MKTNTTERMREEVLDILLNLVYGDIPASELRYLEQAKDKQYAEVLSALAELEALMDLVRIDQLEHIDSLLATHHSEVLKQMGISQHPKEVYPYREIVIDRIAALQPKEKS